MTVLLEPTHMDNIFEKYKEQLEERPIEVNFPLDEKDILRLLKGVEYNQILTLGVFEKPIRIHVKVFSSDRVKYITWENWRKIIDASYSHPALMDIIRKIESEIS